MEGSVYSVNVRGSGGVPKQPVRASFVGFEGVEGDHNKFRSERRDGDPGRAVCIFSIERIRQLQREGHPIDVGTAGENFTIEGIDWLVLEGDTIIEIGGAKIRLSEPCAPCSKIGGSFTDNNFTRVDHDKREGWSRWSAFVIEEGPVSVGDSVFLREA